MTRNSGGVLDAILNSLQESDSIPIRDVRFGPYWTALLSRHCGLASTPHTCHEADAGDRKNPITSDLIGRPALEVAEWASSNDPTRAAIGMAALNSLIEPDLSRASAVNARDLLIEQAPGRSVVIIGHFPFTEELRAAAGQLWVLELRPKPGDLPADRAKEVIPQADIVAITGVTLINHTFDELIAMRRPDSHVVMLGGSTPLSPLLFDFGVDVVGGTVVDDPIQAMGDVERGATFRQIKGKHPVLLFRSD